MNWLPLRAFRAQIFARSKRRCRCPRCREAFIGSALRPDSPPVGQSPGSARRRLLSAIESRSREDLRSLLARDPAVGAARPRDAGAGVSLLAADKRHGPFVTVSSYLSAG